MADTQPLKVELTERGEYCLPRALEISDKLPRLPFWSCLALAEREYDTQEFIDLVFSDSDDNG